MHTGSCLCGDVRFEITGELGPVIACHCSQCRKMSGHFWAATLIPAKNIRIEGYTYVRWFKASDTAARGFCETCGSSLFWRSLTETPEVYDVAAGAFDTPLPPLHHHIYVADKGGYYELADGLPQYPGVD